MNGKPYRLNELLSPLDGHSLVVDASQGLEMGVLPGLEHFGEVVPPLLNLLDGIVTSPGQARQLGKRTRKDAALLVRTDWTNALRGEDFVLPPETIRYVPLMEAADAEALGANGMVNYFILGHEEQIEVSCIQRVVNLAFAGQSLGLPLLVDVQPVGPRLVLRNKAIELGVSYALEGGADGVAIPWPGEASMKTIKAMTREMPVWIKPGSLEPGSAELALAMQLGATGLWLDAALFSSQEPAARLQSFRNLVHPGLAGDQ